MAHIIQAITKEAIEASIKYTSLTGNKINFITDSYVHKELIVQKIIEWTYPRFISLTLLNIYVLNGLKGKYLSINATHKY